MRMTPGKASRPALIGGLRITLQITRTHCGECHGCQPDMANVLGVCWACDTVLVPHKTFSNKFLVT